MARIATSLAQRQTTGLAPAQQQALAILQMPADALVAMLETAIADNPLIVRRDEADAAPAAAKRHRGFVVGRGGMPVLSKFPAAPPGTAPLGDAAERVADPGAATLRAHLLEQLRLEIADPLDRTIGLHLIDLCEETGYLAGDPGDIAGLLGIAPARVDSVLARLRGFEPAGVFARDLADCLALQLGADERNDPAWATLLAHLPLVAAGDRARLATLCRVAPEKIDAMIGRLRRLDPKPGLRFAAGTTVWCVPDILVERDPAGAASGYRVRLNPETMPACELDATGYRRLMTAARHRGEKAGLRDRYETARGLLAAIERRGATLLAIADAIVDHQRGFLDSGIGALRPLTRRRIAQQLELDESTISRAVSAKTMATPRGHFGFDFFFGRAIAVDGGAPVSAAMIRSRLAAMLARESAPLDDAALARRLAEEGLPIARRTVAKYRESLNIPPAHRRREKTGLRRHGGTPHGF